LLVIYLRFKDLRFNDWLLATGYWLLAAFIFDVRHTSMMKLPEARGQKLEA
jgi:hypothetical protein